MRQYIHLISKFLLLALCLNATALFFISNLALSNITGDKILICTSLGPKYISLNEEAPQPTSKQHCPLCIIDIAAGDGAINPAIDNIEVPLITTRYAKNKDKHYFSYFSHHYLSRAPPLFLT